MKAQAITINPVLFCEHGAKTWREPLDILHIIA